MPQWGQWCLGTPGDQRNRHISGHLRRGGAWTAERPGLGTSSAGALPASVSAPRMKTRPARDMPLALDQRKTEEARRASGIYARRASPPYLHTQVCSQGPLWAPTVYSCTTGSIPSRPKIDGGKTSRRVGRCEGFTLLITGLRHPQAQKTSQAGVDLFGVFAGRKVPM